LTAILSINAHAATVAANLRRIMARDNLSLEEVVAATELDARTLRSLARGNSHPHSRTLHKLASGLGISIDELFQPIAHIAPRRFDRATNSLVDDCVAAHAKLFRNWSQEDFDELYSRFGTGGQLTEEGVLAAAQATNQKRDLWQQMSVILETSEADLLSQFVSMLFNHVTTTNHLAAGLAPREAAPITPNAGKPPRSYCSTSDAPQTEPDRLRRAHR
jgi:transcriptional regulator with XRE-family HTH domain